MIFQRKKVIFVENKVKSDTWS